MKSPNCIRIAMQAFIAVLALSLNDSIQFEWTSFSTIIQDLFVIEPATDLIVFLSICLSFYMIDRSVITSSDRRSLRLNTLLCSAVLSVMFCIGQAFSVGSTDVLLGRMVQQVKTAIRFAGVWVLLLYGIRFIYLVAGKKSVTGEKNDGCFTKYRILLKEHPFATAFLTLGIFYIPWIVLTYPAMFMYDTKVQMAMALHLDYDPDAFKYILSDHYVMSNHHPVMHTLLIRFCLMIGLNVFKSWNAGAFLYSLIQTGFFLCAVSYLTRVLVNAGINTKIVMICLFYYVIHPKFYNYTCLITKDMLFSCSVLLALCTTYEFLYNKEEKHAGRMLLFIVLTMLLRNEGAILLGFMFLVGMLLLHQRKKCALCFVFVICVWFTWNHAVLPAAGVRKGSIQEVLSLPFQQTARYVKFWGDEVTEEERAVIDSVLDYDGLAEGYKQRSANPVKDSFRHEATRKDLIQYLKVWFNMFKKHPVTYFEATLRHKYDLFYPAPSLIENDYSFEYSKHQIEYANEQLEAAGVGFSRNATLQEITKGIETIVEIVYRLPVLNILFSGAMYIWTLIIALFYCLYKKLGSGIFFLSPLILDAAVILASPRGGIYFRYFLPIAVCLPTAILFSFAVSEITQTEK